MPLELEIPSLQIQLQDLLLDPKTHQARLDQLLLLYERRFNALYNFKFYHNYLKKD